jgi:endonuclease I
MRKTMILGLALIWVAQLSWAEVNSSQPLKIYYASANGTSDDALRLALYDVIKDHTQIGYKQLGPIMQWSDTENADGVHIVDIYTNCPYTVSGPVSFGNASSVGGGMNREHTVPQSWFGEAEPMRSDVFHVYPTDCKANNNRSSYLFGECANGSSSSTSKCKETGKLGSSDWSVFSGTVYEVVDEYKGDIARSYFYMATRYANVCASWGGGAFGSMNNGLGAYTAELMLKWHQQDPVSEKELIRNEVIYGNPLYNKSSSKQGNRNPFIDYPELVDYIWGSKKNVPVTIDLLESPYANESPATDVEYVLSNEPVAHKVLVNGQIYIVVDEQLFNLQGQRVK